MLEKTLTTWLADISAEIAPAEAELAEARAALVIAEKAEAAWVEEWREFWWSTNLALDQRVLASALANRLQREQASERRSLVESESSAYRLRQRVTNGEYRLDDLLQARSQIGAILARRAAADRPASFEKTPAPVLRAEIDVDFDPTVPGPARRAPAVPVAASVGESR